MLAPFSRGKDSGRPGFATEYNSEENIRGTKVRTDFEMLEVKVPINFSGT